jgi:hypothetical protein
MEQQRERTKNRAALVKSVLLAPLTGGYSLITYFRNRRRGD